ncbi:MAG: aldehyde ferredoxin oxidoreductase N-terminal domain-containing protein [Bacillota bacterium]
MNGAVPLTLMDVDLERGACRLHRREDLREKVGGSSLAAALYREYGLPGEDAFAPGQPLIFAIGPLTGYYPLMSKVVLGFKSPYSGDYVETHAGGRLALALRFSGLDALVIRGKSPRPVYLVLGDRHFACKDAGHLWGMDAVTTARTIRGSEPRGRGQRSILRIGPAGENLVKYACINVDTFRHFGRLGAGAVMGSKKLKAVMVSGDRSFSLPYQGTSYHKVYRQIYQRITGSGVMAKYHDLGTPVNVLVLNGLHSLPTRNLSATTFEGAAQISGEYFADKLLLRQIACSGCPVGCIHIGLLREKFSPEHEYYYKQVSYDHEPIFAMGSMLGIAPGEAVMLLLDEAEKWGLDVISCGVALAWATEARAAGLIGDEQTLVPLAFGKLEPYRQAIAAIATRANEFYRLLGEGTAVAAARYGGAEFACVLGQEMAGYATGPVYFVSQALGFRYSHLDSAGYQLDQQKTSMLEEALNYLEREERQRLMLTCLVACLFARNIYDQETIAAALAAAGFSELAQNLEERFTSLQRERWRVKKESGYDPHRVAIPRRFHEVKTLQGKLDAAFMETLRRAYAARIAGY